MRLLLDANVVVDCLGNREPFYKVARLLMIVGKVGEFELWISASQVSDLIYILSNGGKKALLPQVSRAIESLLGFVNVFATGKEELLSALRASWDDPEDAIIHAVALKLKADAIITRNGKDFSKSSVPVMDCEEFFARLEEKGLVYEELAWV